MLARRDADAVTMHESAPWPFVTERASSVASSMFDTAWVAPMSRANSRFSSTGSQAMIVVAPAWAAPCTALMPMPPMPITITVWPGRTWAEFTAEPQPVGTPQPTRQITSSGRSSGTFTAERVEIVVHWLNVEIPDIWPIGWPCSVRR